MKNILLKTKAFFVNNHLVIILFAVLLVLLVFGGMFGRYASETALASIDENREKYFDEVELVSVDYNLDYTSFVEKPLIVTASYQDTTYEMYVDFEFQFIEMISDTETNSLVLAAVEYHLENDRTLSLRAQFLSYDPATRTVEMTTKGYAGQIDVTVVLGNNFDSVASYTVDTSENYDNEYNADYTGGPVPEVEHYMMDQFVGGTVDVDTVAGASAGTGVALQDLITLLNQFMMSLNGGN